MADGNAPASAYESFSDFHDFSSQQKDWQQPFDMDLTLRADGLYIPPERTLSDHHARWMEHPEAVDDDEDEDDDMYDFDFPAGTSYSYPPESPELAYPTMTNGYTNEDITLGSGYDIYRGPTSFATSDDLYALPYRAPVDSVAPGDLQLSRDPIPSPVDDMPRFEPATPIDYDAMDVTPDLINDDLSNEGSPEDYSYDLELDLERPTPSQLHEPLMPHELKSSQVHVEHARPEAFAEPPSAPARHTTTGGAKRKKVAHGPHRCDMALPNGDACNKAFTRPYDLARHQETIHAQVRKMFTCSECGDKSKTFSRMDALSRHIRIKHSRKD